MSDLVVVALPKEDDYVNRISSEPAPHMTILFLGDADTNQNIGEIQDFLEHAAETMLTPFGMEVDYRGTLGQDEADVLFFNTPNWDFPRVTRFRDALLQNTAILNAYNSIEQFEEWQPHLTLGYPATPAHQDDRDYSGIGWVSFDRIALWTSENAGPEFRLTNIKDPFELSMSDVDVVVADILNHSGIKGMKWGVRKDRASGPSLGDRGRHVTKVLITPNERSLIVKGTRKTQAILASHQGKGPLGAKVVVARTKQVDKYAAKLNARSDKRTAKASPQEIVAESKGKKIVVKGGENHPAHPDALAAKTAQQKLKKSGLNALSNKELQDLGSRLNLEQQVSKLAIQAGSPAHKFVADVLEKKNRNLSDAASRKGLVNLFGK